MILACPGCDGRYDVTGHPAGQQFRCRCGVVMTLEAPSPQAGLLACPHCGAGVAPTASACAHCQHELLVKACPRCLSRVFHGHKHCPECGSELSIAAMGDDHVDRACGRCDLPLAPRRVQDVVIDECTKCHGVFMDHVAIQRIIGDRQQARAEALLGALPKASISPVPTGTRMYIKCPICSVVMNRKQFAMGAGVVIDVCKHHGTFFDPGELPRIIEFVMQGGLERAEKKAIERMRDQAKREQLDAKYAMAQSGRSTAELRLSRSPEASSGAALVDFLLWITN